MMIERRIFLMAVGALGVFSAAASPRLAWDRLKSASGRKVRLAGWLQPADTRFGHVFVLAAREGRGDPGADHAAGWPQGQVRVYPADTAAMRPGYVELTGRLQVGHFRDINTDTAASAVLLDARPA